VAYTDGATSNNQDASRRVAGFGIHWYDDVSERCPGKPGEGKTNNFAELLAIIRVLELMGEDGRPLRILSDSEYAIKAFERLAKWKRNGWRLDGGKPVKNLLMIRYMVALRDLRRARGFKVEIAHVKGHGDDQGNIRADFLARAG
ncbi:ribonuclease H-like domain-containing protein, partial [Vararia minispora EC-137]